MEVVGNTLQGVAKFFIGKGNEEADWAFELAKMKKLAFSVGFIPNMDKAVPLHKDDAFGVRGMEFNGQELLEVSAVTVPSNPDALQRMMLLIRLLTGSLLDYKKQMTKIKEAAISPDIAVAQKTKKKMTKTQRMNQILRMKIKNLKMNLRKRNLTLTHMQQQLQLQNKHYRRQSYERWNATITGRTGRCSK